MQFQKITFVLIAVLCLLLSSISAQNFFNTLSSKPGVKEPCVDGVDGCLLHAEILENAGKDESGKSIACKLSESRPENCKNIKSLVDKSSEKILNVLNRLVLFSYFRYVKLNLNKPCPFWTEEVMCTSRNCEIKIADKKLVETQLPYMFEDRNLGDVVEIPKERKKVITECKKENEFCILDDENGPGSYVDMSLNPERFTGYAGHSSHMIWRSIYEGNCFNFAESQLEPCYERLIFYRVVSGLHASISVHLCSDFLDQKSGKWYANEECYWSRVGNHPQRLENLRLVYALLVRGVERLESSLGDGMKYICSGKEDKDAQVRVLLTELFSLTKNSLPVERGMFEGSSSKLLNEFRTKFRNISAITDCISCQKCRLWGKTQITGVGTAMKLIFAPEAEEPLKLSRQEIASLVHSIHKLSESLRDIKMFEKKRAMRKNMGSSSVADSKLNNVPEETAADLSASSIKYYTILGATIIAAAIICAFGLRRIGGQGTSTNKNIKKVSSSSKNK